MFHKIIATILAVSLVSSLTFAQEMPGNAAPVSPVTSEEEVIPVLKSAPLEEKTDISLSEISVTTELDEAVLSFSTNIPVHAVIDYGLTDEYDHSVSTEPGKIHNETIGNLQECSKYFYQVRVSDISSSGEFKTRCPAKQPVVKKATPVLKKTPILPTEKETINDEQEIVLNAAPEQKPEPEQKIEPGMIGSDNSVNTGNIENSVTPETPTLPGPIAFGNDTLTDKADADNAAPVGLLLFALLSGMVLALFAFKKKKKWYQR